MDMLHLDQNDKCHTFFLHVDMTGQSWLTKHWPRIPCSSASTRMLSPAAGLEETLLEHYGHKFIDIGKRFLSTLRHNTVHRLGFSCCAGFQGRSRRTAILWHYEAFFKERSEVLTSQFIQNRGSSYEEYTHYINNLVSVDSWQLQCTYNFVK
jgi:hypothetical protein